MLCHLLCIPWCSTEASSCFTICYLQKIGASSFVEYIAFRPGTGCRNIFYRGRFLLA